MFWLEIVVLFVVFFVDLDNVDTFVDNRVDRFLKSHPQNNNELDRQHCE